MHFAYGFKKMCYGKSPEDEDWLTHKDVDTKKLYAKYGSPRRPYFKVPLPNIWKSKLIKICSEARVSNLAKSCAYPEWLAYIGWTLFGLKITSINYENLCNNNSTKQLKEFMMRSRSKDDSKLRKFLDNIVKSEDKLLDHFDLGELACLMTHKKTPMGCNLPERN
jgi:hypothetical protein